MKSIYLAFAIMLGAAASTLHAQRSMRDIMSEQTPVPADRESTAPTKGHDTANAKARAAAASVAQSFQQQAGQEAEQPAAASDAGSINLPYQELQEPEAVGFNTGSNLPAPELLHDVLQRAPMSYESFIALADQTNPTLAQAERNVDRSRQQARQVSLPPDPIIGYSGDHIRGGEYHGGEQGAFLSQEFVLGHKLALRRDIYLAEGLANQLSVAIQRAKIHNDVGRAFFDGLTAQQSVVIHGRLLQTALDADTNTHELARIGQADAADILTAEIAAEQAKVEFVNAQRLFLAAFAQLATYAGQASLAPHPLQGELVGPPQLDAEAMVMTDMQASPAVQQAQANVAVAEARVKSAKREKVPDFNLKAGEWYSGEELGSTKAKAGPESFVEASMQLPLWNHNQGNLGAAGVALVRAQQEVTRTQLLTRNRAEPCAQQYQTARFAAERYRTEMLPRAHRAYQLEVMKYQQMAEAYPHVLTAQRMLFALQLSYIQALNEEWKAAIALENYALMNGLDEPTSVGTDATAINLPVAPGVSN